MVKHYNEEHQDLVKLGLRIELSKAKRKELRRERRKKKAQGIIMGEPVEMSETDSQESTEYGTRPYPEQDPLISAA